ncbi:MAG: FAD-dependent oxidoreductase [Alistipes sp.]|nr:FAD-dependent oxidoreductase [Candidatus Alistipes equi]
MKTFKNLLIFLAVYSVFVVSASNKSQILIEAESFIDKGGWLVDQQWMDQMGSPYLIAHGAGRPVKDATTRFFVPVSGHYHIYARTFNWTSPFFTGKGPGAFQILVNGIALQSIGDEGSCWMWHKAGELDIEKGNVEIALHDLHGLEGRCDAILLSSEPLKKTQTTKEEMEELRCALDKDRNKAIFEGEFDFVVIGGGYSGICASVAAARLGLKVALIQDRKILGGNNSTEVRVQMGGSIDCEPYPNLGNLLKEFAPTKKGNAMDPSYYCDEKKVQIVANEENIRLFSPIHISAVEKRGDKIIAVLGRGTEDGRLHRFSAPLFADCTGDGTIGMLSGAEYMVGREAKSRFNEPSAPQEADQMTLGCSIQWNSKDYGKEVSFPEVDYGFSFNEESFQEVTRGVWTWENGMMRDQIKEGETIRDYGMLAILANWSYLKNHSSVKDKYKTRNIDWMGYISGRRESRRLVGDYIMTENDFWSGKVPEDATLTSSWTIDLHYPDPKNTKFFPGREFMSVCCQCETPLTPIPYRCLYTKDVENLFMAGRDISVSHIALGSVRVMRTTAMMGEVVGMAASVCHKRHCLPRDIYKSYFTDLKALMMEGVGKYGLKNNQLTNVGRHAHHYFAPEKNIVVKTPSFTFPSNVETKTLTVNKVSFDIVKVEGGTFRMGAEDDDFRAFNAERPCHDVELSSYYIGRTEVTQELWQSVMGYNPSMCIGDKHPVERASWADIHEFLDRLSNATGLHFRLPTEAEWEFAARGGNLSRGYIYSGSNEFESVAWNVDTSLGTTHEVATKLPNELGLFDMSGNVWEWCEDFFGRYPSKFEKNPKGYGHAYRVLRGGSWCASQRSCRSTTRSYDGTEAKVFTNGFRFVVQ